MNKPDPVTKIICLGMLIILLLSGCSPLKRSGPGEVPGKTSSGQGTEWETVEDVEIAPGDTRQINMEISDLTDEMLSSSSSMFYIAGPDRATNKNDFLPDDMERPLPAQAYKPSPGTTYTPVTVSPQGSTDSPAKPEKPAVSPARPSPGATHQAGELAEAKARYDEAYKNYTDIVTGKKKGDAGAAQAEYRAAYNRYRELRMKTEK